MVSPCPKLMNTIIISTTHRFRFYVIRYVMLPRHHFYFGIMIQHFAPILDKLSAVISLDHIALYHYHRFQILVVVLPVYQFDK
uniref:Uncharacterized protein n=1 Tax=Elaeophora elaphi TaxID=1147741 RepID=A0A0R3RNV4_9BILA